MPLFRREYRLIFGRPGSERGGQVTDLQIQFNIVKTSESTKNKATISVYNMAKDTRALLQNSNDDDTNNPVIILQTQYAEDVTDTQSLRGFQTLFTGQVVNSITSKKDGDMVTRIEAQDGYIPVREGVISENFPPGTSRRVVLNSLIRRLGVPVGEIRDGGLLDQKFSNGVTVEGPIKLALDKLLDPVNIDWSIQDDSFIAIRKDLTSSESILSLSPETGLIGSPQAKKARSNRTTKSENEPEAGIQVMTLLAPALVPNRRVKVISNQFPDGQIFKATRVRHKGDFRGNNWITEAELADTN